MMINNLVRKNIQLLKPYSSARGNFLDGILLDANENSFGSVINSKLKLNRYPDPNQTELRKAIARYLSISFKNIFVGVGSDEVIDLLIRIFCEPGKDRVLICEPTYGMYKVACDINNVKTKTVLLKDDFNIDVNSVIKSINTNTKMIFLCSPNNPTGNLLSLKDIKEIAKKFNGIIVIDEAYIDFANEKNHLKIFHNFNNVVILRTFSKAWGMAGVRCGFIVADEEIINVLFKVKSPYNINKLTSDIILSALKKHDKKDKFVKMIVSERDKMLAELAKLNGVVKVFPSEANYILFKVNDANYVYNSLVKKGIIIRNRSTQIKLENCLRVSIGTPEQNKIFLKELKKLL